MPPPEGARRTFPGKRVAPVALLAAAAIALLAWSARPSLEVWLKGTLHHPFEGTQELDLRAVNYLFDLAGRAQDYRFDPVAHFLPRPERTTSWPWPEHERGEFVQRTNNLGFREDGPTGAEKRGLRVLVAGDSHTAGAVANAENFVNLAEEELRRARPGAPVELLDAAVPFTGPHCYLGVLQKYLELRPDLFVAVLFSGNDFWDDLNVRYYLDGWSAPRGGEQYMARLRAAAERWPGPVSQGLNQAYRFKHFAGEAGRALEAVLASFLAMRDLCAREGIAFLAVVLPTKMDVDEDDRETVEAARAALGLEPADLGVNRDLARRFVEAARAAGIRCLDPYEEMRASPAKLYWQRDHHLGQAGHVLVAELLAREIRAVLESR